MALVETAVRPRLAPHVRMRFDAVRGQHVLLSPETVWVINDVGAAILELCDGRRTVAEIESALTHRYADIAPGDVQRYLDALAADAGVVVNHG